DTLSGGEGADVFEYRNGDGIDVITDFNGAEGDVLFLNKVSAIRDFDDLMSNHVSQVGDDILIKKDANNYITMENVRISDLSVDDFMF
ncbi:MAG: calcium-binding protein, partial [Paracoccaceae bacterium]